MREGSLIGWQMHCKIGLIRHDCFLGVDGKYRLFLRGGSLLMLKERDPGILSI